MAKEFSFDIVSEIDYQEMDNACQQVKREISTRYDLKDSGSSLNFDKSNNELVVCAPSDFVANQIVDIVGSKAIKRGIELSALRWNKTQDAAGATVRKTANIISGIDRETASKINKDIKGQKFKAKVQIEGDKLRVSSASKDVLQSVISFVSENDYGQPLQYVNYR